MKCFTDRPFVRGTFPGSFVDLMQGRTTAATPACAAMMRSRSMDPMITPSDTGKGSKHGPYERALSDVVKKLTNESYIFVIGIAILMAGLAMLGSAFGIADLRFIVLVIAFLALTVIIGYFVIEVRGKVVAQGEQLTEQQIVVQAIQLALKGILTKFEIDYLRRLTAAKPWRCRYDPDTYYRLKRLDDMGFVLPTVIDGHRRLLRIQELFGDESIPVKDRQWFDMKEYVEITEAGKDYLAAADRLEQLSILRTSPSSL
jgi:hypothetical protein